jgi:hypothetical protein
MKFKRSEAKMFVIINVGFMVAVKRVKRFIGFLVICYFNFKYIYFNQRIVFEIKNVKFNQNTATGCSSPLEGEQAIKSQR